MAEENDDLGYQLARRYREACEDISFDNDGYWKWVEDQYAKHPVVYLVWLDSTKPHDIDYEPLKDQRPAGLYRPEAIHCESRERAMTIKTMLLAADPDALPEN
jgi:hypothetical protein